MPLAAQRFAQVTDQAAHIGAASAFNFELKTEVSERNQAQRLDLDFARRQFDLLAARNDLRSGAQLEALDTFRRLVAERPEEVEVGREYAWALLQSGLSDEALRVASALPQDRDTRRQLAAIHSARSNFMEAERIVRSLVREEPEDSALRLDLANLLVWQQDYEGAVRTYQKLHAKDPADLEVALSLGETLTWAGRADEALDLFGALIDRGARGGRLTGGFLDALLGARTPGTADAHRLHIMLERHVTEEPLGGELAGRLGLALVRIGSTGEGIDLLEDELEHRPEDRELRLSLADALVTAGEHDRAHQHYRYLLASTRSR
jgi:thioredoxin-like negative regulator of GroEL